MLAQDRGFWLLCDRLYGAAFDVWTAAQQHIHNPGACELDAEGLLGAAGVRQLQGAVAALEAVAQPRRRAWLCVGHAKEGHTL